MKTIFAVLCLTLVLTGSASAAVVLEMAGTKLEPSVTVNGHVLKLNGSGIRKKLFVKVYIGSLYAEKRLDRAAAALNDRGDKLVRMTFLHSKVGKDKIIEAFTEGFANNSPDLAGSADVKKFLALITSDFSRGDVVDLTLAADGTVTATHNGKPLGTIVSAKLSKGILAIWLGEKPADEGLKKGMLGYE